MGGMCFFYRLSISGRDKPGGVDGLTGGEHVAELDGFGGTGVGPAGTVACAGSDGGRELAGGQELDRTVLLCTCSRYRNTIASQSRESQKRAARHEPIARPSNPSIGRLGSVQKADARVGLYFTALQAATGCTALLNAKDKTGREGGKKTRATRLD